MASEDAMEKLIAVLLGIDPSPQAQEAKFDAQIDMLVRAGITRDDATIAVDLGNKAAMAAIEALTAVTQTAPTDELKLVSQYQALKVVEVNSHDAIRAMLTLSLFGAIFGGGKR